jgi:hypothetical protein
MKKLKGCKNATGRVMAELPAGAGSIDALGKYFPQVLLRTMRSCMGRAKSPGEIQA